MFTRFLLASSLAALAAAQSASLTFTHVNNPITDGQAQALTYSTNDTTTPVTIILRKGLATDLQTVSTLTTSATGGQFVWTPTCLVDGVDYALQISQGSQVNYFGPFVIQGYAAQSCSSSSATASATAYVSSTVSANGTASTTVPIAPITTVGTISAGTGTALPRNTTISIATLTSPSAPSTTSSPSDSTADATTSSSSSASASSIPNVNGASGIQVSGVVSLMLGVAAAVFYLQ
ncbi:hypothetical protein LTR56_024477 [Elasticomyces elasticus]|nr:hypothetical protein LTR56_024477 [Elasticomyces elasticus]KAK3634672.1 hypothetical protein LTR22_019567 [Elasticomyces elasticus]KAK4911360.1 hypothetical protein LTR49_020099 [Elasticomyces elasticus]KAK5751630.1 hypothetical protein LTS12_018335 [Elasticomyces elasticus]